MVSLYRDHHPFSRSSHLVGTIHRLIKTQIGHARDFTWYRGQRPSPARVILSHERVQIHARENLCSYATNPPHFRVCELLLCDILITRAGDGRWPRYQAKSLACPGCGTIALRIQRQILHTQLRASRSAPRSYSVTGQRGIFSNNDLSRHLVGTLT